MASDELGQVLDAAAHDGEMDYSQWPGLLKVVLARLDDIAQNTFPIPTLPPLTRPPIPQFHTQSSLGEEPSIAASSQQTELLPTTQSSQPDKSIPAPLQTFFDSLKSNLTNTFSEKPPYTIQRLAELLLVPEKHYRTLPAFLRAVDRVVSVSSTADVFPLPPTVVDANGSANSGSDDFNGAQLTEIPWLKNRENDWVRDSADMMGIDDRSMAADLRTESTLLIDGPNGAGSIETVTVAMNGAGKVEDQSLHADSAAAENVTPAAETSSSSSAMAIDEESKEAIPHARGPEEIGMEDMGPQSASTANDSGPADSKEAAERAVGRPGEAERVADEKSSEDNDSTFTTEHKDAQT